MSEWKSAFSSNQMCQFSAKTDSFNFSVQICSKMAFVIGISNICPDSESAPPRYHVCQFSVKTDNFEIFNLNLGKLPNYVRYFGSNNVEGNAEC